MKPPDNILVRILGARGRGAEGDGKFRIEPDRLSVIGDGAGELTLVEVRETAVVVGEGELGIEPNRLVEVGDGAVELMLAAVREATVVAGIAPFFASSLRPGESACRRQCCGPGRSPAQSSNSR
jgi:hypothetical protein